jgi:hypothetical protein
MSKIVMFVEGLTETALKPALKGYLDTLCDSSGRPRIGLAMKPMDSDLLSEAKLRRRIGENLKDAAVTGVIALIDVHCASGDRRFKDAQEAIAFLQRSHPGDDPRFRPHAAQYEVEAWLLPFWGDICSRLKVSSQPPGANPEAVDNDHPPSHHLSTLYRKAGRRYDKPRDAPAILTTERLTVAAAKCPQLQALLTSLDDLSKPASP